MSHSERSSWISSALVERAAELGLRGVADAEYYECRLAAAPAQLDYLVAFSRSNAAVAQRRLSALSEQSAPGEQRSWAPLLELFRAWNDGRSALSTLAPTIWLEFDDVRATEPYRGFPSVSVCLVPGYRTDEPLGSANASRGLRLVHDVLDRLGGDRGQARARLLGECFGALPAAARWIHVSVMLGRTPQALKLYGSLPRGELLPFLKRVGFRADMAAIQALLEHEYAADVAGDELLVDLNLDNCHDPRRCTLGLALGQQQLARGPDADPRRARALERWLAAGLCSPDKVALAQGWLGGGARGRFLDLKLVWGASTGALAKAYLGAHASASARSARASRTSGGS
jgi:hypothetical protein